MSLDGYRLQRLVGRGFLLSQAIERWQARAIWVVSRADAEYPRHLKARLREDAPAILCGCGDRIIATAILDRLLHHAVTLNVRGNSYRLKDKLKAGLIRGHDNDGSQPGGEI